MAIVSVLRNITWAVQIFPFVYTALYIPVFIAYNFAPDTALDILDALFYVSPVVILAQLLYSRLLKLCIWHRIACCIPLLAELVDFTDSYIYQLSANQVYIINITIVVMIVLYAIAFYKVFFTDNGRPPC